MILLQLSGGAFGGMEIIKSIFGQFGVVFLIKSAIFLFFLYWSLSETLKVYTRRNIGKKAFSFSGAVAGATVYLGWGIFLLISAIAIFFFSYDNSYGFETYSTFQIILTIFFTLYVTASGIISSWAAFKILHRAMHEYYRAKSENSQEWRILEYRGDSIDFQGHLKNGYSQKAIWQKLEPQQYFKKSLSLLIPFFFFAILLIVNAIIFMIHEWYHITYLPNKRKEDYLNMKIEMDKARIHYNSASTEEDIPRVKIN